jgi:S-adenosylmethionine:tRNA ribosyltransferase-isomerase
MTDLYITPDRGLKVVNGMLTGFHEPKASHLLMLEALASRHHLLKAYEAAIEGKYQWHEFGDLHLIV